MIHPRSAAFLAHLLLLALLAVARAPAALAESFATVASLSVPGPRGAWRPVRATGEAVRLRDGAEVPLEVGLELAPGDVVGTDLVRVEVRLHDSQSFTIGEGSRITIRERGVIQELGDAWYRVRGAFSVRYGSVEAVVEGTRFLVSGPDPVRVAVAKGRVRVSGAGASTVIERGQQLAASQGAAPGQPGRWSAARQVEDLRFTWPRGEPRWRLGVMGGLGLGPGTIPGGLVFGRMTLLPGLALAADAGTWGVPRSGGLRHEATLGLAFSAGPVVLGGRFEGTLERSVSECGSAGLLHLGGLATAGAGLPLGRRLDLELEARAGWSDGPQLQGLVGLGFAP